MSSGRLTDIKAITFDVQGTCEMECRREVVGRTRPFELIEKPEPLLRKREWQRLAARGACFGAKMGWERVNWLAPAGVEPRTEYAFGRHQATLDDAMRGLLKLYADDAPYPTGRLRVRIDPSLFPEATDLRGGIMDLETDGGMLFEKLAPLIVMAPPPVIGPVFGVTEVTVGQPSPPWSAIASVLSMGAPRPLASSKPAMAV